MKLDFYEKSHLAVSIGIYLLLLISLPYAISSQFNGFIIPIIIVFIFIQLLIHLLPRRKNK
jgi:multisubunit Na+/H+ antiporter MnhG subunit